MHTTRFAHHRLDAFHVARNALVGGDALVRKLPRGYAPLGDQLRRALLGAYLQLTEAAARDGNDRRQRFRCARAQCNEAAAAVEGALALGLVAETDAHAVLVNLDRLAAMLTRLGGFASSSALRRRTSNGVRRACATASAVAIAARGSGLRALGARGSRGSGLGARRL